MKDSGHLVLVQESLSRPLLRSLFDRPMIRAELIIGCSDDDSELDSLVGGLEEVTYRPRGKSRP